MKKECEPKTREQNALNSYLGNLLVSLDQTGNAIAGGYADSTVSARVWYYSNKDYPSSQIWRKKYWNGLRRIIDWAFLPFDKENHCKKAFENDPDELFVHGSYIALFVLGLLVLFFTPLIGTIMRIAKLIKLI